MKRVGVIAALIALGILGPSPGGWAQDAAPGAQSQRVTEADVIRLAAAASPTLAGAQAQVRLAQAGVSAAGVLDNPSLHWQREALPGGADAEHEDAFSVSVPLDLSGRRSARRGLARAQVELQRANARWTRTQVTVAALSLFYDALGATAAVEIAERTHARLAEAARVLGHRHAQGAVSGQDRLRLEVELALAQSQLAERVAERARAHTLLAARLGLPGAVLVLDGELGAGAESMASTDTRGDGAAAARDAAAPASQTHLDAALGHLRQASDSAGGFYMPRLELNGGARLASAADTRVGYVAGLSIELPLLARADALQEEIDAAARVARERSAERGFEARAEVDVAAAQLTALRQEIGRLDASLGSRLDALEQAALASYREGESDLMALLDAQRTREAVEHRRMSLQLMVKHAQLALRAAMGELE